MAAVLVVDDDNDHAKLLESALAQKGHAAIRATSGRRAIAAGLRARPDVLVTEWLLGDPPDGIQVNECLRAVRSDTQAILVTRFPSHDLRHAALEAGFFGFFSSPVDLDKLSTAVEHAATTPPVCPPAFSVAAVEHDEAGKLEFANASARELLHLPEDAGAQQRIDHLFTKRSLQGLAAGRGEWATLVTPGANPLQIEAVAIHSGGGKQLLILATDPDQKASPVVRALIDAGATRVRSEAFRALKKRVLLIDEDYLQRRLAARNIESLGFQVHSAESYERAKLLIEADENIGCVIVDYGPQGASVTELVRSIQDFHPEVRIVGTSAGIRKREFEAMGVNDFILKPTTANVLKSLFQ